MSTSKSVRTFTVQEGNTVKTVTETTITTPDGKTTTQREEKITTKGGQGASGGGAIGSRDRDDIFKGFEDSKGRKDRDDMFKRFEDMKMPQGGSFPSKSSSSSTPSTGPSGGSVSLSDFRQQSLKAHNERRAKHKVPPLKLSSDLNDYAQKWADHLLKTNTFQHSSCSLGNTRLGENIANKWSSAGTDYTGEEVTEQWYSEITKHDFNNDRNAGTGHFTQVVWKESQELGMGKAKGSDGTVIVVGSYRPAGNLIGSFLKNVFPPK